MTNDLVGSPVVYIDEICIIRALMSDGYVILEGENAYYIIKITDCRPVMGRQLGRRTIREMFHTEDCCDDSKIIAAWNKTLCIWKRCDSVLYRFKIALQGLMNP